MLSPDNCLDLNQQSDYVWQVFHEYNIYIVVELWSNSIPALGIY